MQFAGLKLKSELNTGINFTRLSKSLIITPGATRRDETVIWEILIQFHFKRLFGHHVHLGAVKISLIKNDFS